jgi:hypothetical protein
MAMVDLDAMIRKMDSLVAVIDKQLAADDLAKRTQRFTLEHDDGNDGYGDNAAVDDSWSEHADASASGNNADLDDGDGYDDDEEEDDGGQLSNIGKATINAAQLRNNPSNRPGDLATSSHPSSSNSRHKFEAMVDRLVNENQLPRSQAQALARKTYPELYRHYVGSASYLKAAPGSFEQLVQSELAKSPHATFEQCAQRVVQAHGYRAFDRRSLSKREAVSASAEIELMEKAESIYRDSGLSRCESLRAARQESPRLMKALR